MGQSTKAMAIYVVSYNTAKLSVCCAYSTKAGAIRNRRLLRAKHGGAFSYWEIRVIEVPRSREDFCEWLNSGSAIAFGVSSK